MTVTALPAQHNTSVEAKLVRITPAMARQLLAKNTVNRNLRRGVVEAYRRDMEQGRWGMTGEALQFSRTDKMLNGQHRMTALAGSTLEEGIDFLVVTGLDDYAQELMDQGAGRSIADAMKIRQDVKNVSVVASLARWLVLHPEPGVAGMLQNLKGKASAAETLEAQNELHEEMEYAAKRAVAMKKHVPVSQAALAYTWLHLTRVNAQACNEFFGAMIDMSFDVVGDPRKAALKRLQALANDPDKRGNKGASVAVVSVLTRAWNDWRQGKQVNTYLARNSKGQVIEPVQPV